MHFQPAVDWLLEWGNVHKVILPDGARSAWYMVIHYITPTYVRCHRNRLTDTENCTECGRQDAVLRRLTECGVRQVIRDLTSTQTDQIQRADPKRVRKERLFRPCFKLLPRQRHQAILWFWGVWGFMC
jgi:hypothetical protein